MHFSMVSRDGREAIAASADGINFFGLDKGHSSYPGDLDDLLHRCADLSVVGNELMSERQIPMDSVRFLPPLRRSGKILCIGLNYEDHSKESNHAVPEYPVVFARFISSLLAHGEAILRPTVSDKLDYEGELVAVIGKGGRNIPLTSALEHVAGYSLFNDATIRDYQFRTHQWTMGKNFDQTGAFGPSLTTASSLPPGCKGLHLSTRLNGETVQSAPVSMMVFDVATLVSLASEVMTLSPGDMIVTGTPSGVGAAKTPPVYMKPGDVCEIEIPGIGILRNPVI